MYQNPFTERFLVIAEKPSFARTIAQVLVCEDKKGGYLEGPEGAVRWCFGHLAEYAMPDAYDERCRKWTLEALPIIPEKWKPEVTGDKAKQFKILLSIRAPRFHRCTPKLRSTGHSRRNTTRRIRFLRQWSGQAVPIWRRTLNARASVRRRPGQASSTS